MFHSINILAISDNATYVMFGISSLISLGVGGGLLIVFRVLDSHKAVVISLSGKIDSAETTRREELRVSESRRIDEAKEYESKVHEITQKLIDLRLRDVTHQVQTHAQTMTGTMDLVTKRVAASEERLSIIGESRHQSQLELTKAIGSLREFVRECAVTREEYSETKESIKELTAAVNKVEKENVSHADMRKLMLELVTEVRRGG